VTGRLRFIARPLTLRRDSPETYGVFLVRACGREECLAYGDRARMEGIAARLQDQEDDRHRPAPG
jgi:hypothetical protein